MSGTGMVAGVITVSGDGTYTAVPALGPFNVPATATSRAQAIFEGRCFGFASIPTVGIIAKMTAAQQARIEDPLTSPPTTTKGKVMQGIADDVNSFVAADTAYIQANAVAHVTSQSLGQTPNPNNASTPIVAPSSAVNIPIQ